MKHLPALALFYLACAASPLFGASSNKPTPDKLTLPEIMACYLKAQGGSTYIESIETLRMEGTIAQDGKHIPFVQVKKQPDMMRMTLDLENVELIMGYNGETAWQTTRGRKQAVELTGKERKEMIRNASMFNQLYQPHNPRIKLKLIGEDEFDGMPVYVIETTLEDGMVQRYTIDQENFLDRRLEYTQVVDGVPHHMEFHYRDIHPLDKLQLPHRIDCYQDGELTSVIALDNVSVDTGVYLPYFDPPGGIEGKDEPPSEKASGPAAKATGNTITGSDVLPGITLSAN